MAIRRLGWWLTAAAAMVACKSGGEAASHAGATGGSPSSSGGQAGPLGGSPTPASNGELTVTLQNSGRHGYDLLFTIQGGDAAGLTTEAQVQLLDAANAPVVAFDTNWDGLPDSAQKRLHFDQSTLGQKTFKQTITLPQLYAQAPTIASAIVALSDANGTLSPSVTVTLLPQAIAKQGDRCDTSDVADRCADGLWCTGTPATCQMAASPSLTRVAYYGGDSPSELILGSDQAEDLSSLRIDFLDSNNKPVIVDLSGDNTPGSSAIVDVRSAAGQTFFFENDPVAAFTAVVPKIQVTPTDSLGHVGAPVMATLAAQPTLAAELSCDAYGFSQCAAGTACSPGVPGITNRCTGLSVLQTAKCAAAPQATSAGLLSAWGVVSGISVWDPPAGCAPATAVGHPESVVMLTLTQSVSALTISTATPETNFNTVVYVLPECTTSSSGALGCNDDTQGYSSTVTLANVPAGSYAIVVDSVTQQTGQFGLAITAM
jgi:hypothetical protein